MHLNYFPRVKFCIWMNFHQKESCWIILMVLYSHYCFAKLCCCIFGNLEFECGKSSKNSTIFHIKLGQMILIQIRALNFVCNFLLDAGTLSIEHFQHFINRLYLRQGVSERYWIWLPRNVWHTHTDTSTHELLFFEKEERKNDAIMDLSRTWVCVFCLMRWRVMR